MKNIYEKIIDKEIERLRSETKKLTEIRQKRGSLFVKQINLKLLNINDQIILLNKIKKEAQA